MAIAQRGSTTNATNASVGASGTLACNKPTGVVQNDFMVALVTTNDDTLTGPSGWTKQLDNVAGTAGTDHFEQSIWTKVAGAAEGTTYTWTKSGTATAAPMAISIIAFSGVSTTTPVAGKACNTHVNTDLTDPVSTGTCATSGYTLTLYGRSIRISGLTTPGTVATFSTTDTDVTELEDVGIYSGGTVSYSHSLYMRNWQSFAKPNSDSISISQTNSLSLNESNNITLVMTLTDAISETFKNTSNINVATKRAGFY